jgi:hypothetical protein
MMQVARRLAAILAGDFGQEAEVLARSQQWLLLEGGKASKAAAGAPAHSAKLRVSRAYGLAPTRESPPIQPHKMSLGN